MVSNLCQSMLPGLREMPQDDFLLWQVRVELRYDTSPVVIEFSDQIRRIPDWGFVFGITHPLWSLCPKNASHWPIRSSNISFSLYQLMKVKKLIRVGWASPSPPDLLPDYFLEVHQLAIR